MKNKFFAFVYIIIALLVGFFIVELFFRNFVYYSDSLNVTKASEKWYKRYWQPVNSMGYRDVELIQKKDKKNILVLGDSIVAGQGIENYKDRFSNLLEDFLGFSWSVNIAAQSGWDVPQFYRALIAYPKKTDIIILNYYIDDIREIAMNHSLFVFPRNLFQKPNKLFRDSEVLNFLYYTYFKLAYGKELKENYFKHLKRAYDDKIIWNEQKLKLEQIIQYAKNNKIKLLVLLCPSLSDLESSSELLYKVNNYFKMCGIPSLNLASIVKGREIKKLMVGLSDVHPGEEFHLLLAKSIYRKLKSLKWLELRD